MELIITVFFIICVDVRGLDLYLTLHAICQTNDGCLQLDGLSQMHQILRLLARVLVLQIWLLVEHDVKAQRLGLVVKERGRVCWPAAHDLR